MDELDTNGCDFLCGDCLYLAGDDGLRSGVAVHGAKRVSADFDNPGRSSFHWSAIGGLYPSCVPGGQRHYSLGSVGGVSGVAPGAVALGVMGNGASGRRF